MKETGYKKNNILESILDVIAFRQEISLKYLENIAKELVSSSLVSAQHGKGGGYKLTRSPDDYTVFDILSIVEKDMAPVACLEENSPVCSRSSFCKTLSVWKGLYGVIRDYLSKITLAELAANGIASNWVI